MRAIYLLLALVGLSQAVDWDVMTELDFYVDVSEDVYGYSVLNIETVPGATVHVLNLTSLTWFDEQLTTTPVWWHYFVVVIPDNVVYADAALLDISNGDNTDGAPNSNSSDVQDLISFAVDTGAVAAMIEQVPNQPLYFTEEENGTRPRTEDAIIGYTWKLFVEMTYTENHVNVLFPMVKSAKQAVDALIEYANSVDSSLRINQVMPTGFSKRGWTTWLLGCVDHRVFAMAPVVFDLLNFYENLQGHYMNLGGWSWAFTPYWNTGVPSYLHHPRTQILGNDIDPLSYNERLTMPKHLHGATGDEFFLPDGTHSWYNNINGEFHYTIFPNEHHSVGDHRIPLWENVESLFVNVKEASARPVYTFTRTVDPVGLTGTIRLDSSTPPNYVKVWMADNTNRTCEPDDDITGTCRRDFRLDRFNVPTDTLIEHVEDVPTDLGNGVYEATYPFRTDFGYRIFHMEVGYPGASGREMVVTSETCILPDTRPFPICTTEAECQGEIK